MPYGLVRHLALACLRGKGPKYMVVFRAYFDATATPDKSVESVAGFVSRVHKWERFEKQWRDLLPETVTMFHMTDFVSSRGGWESWKGAEHSKRRAELIEKLASCIKLATNKGFAHTLRASDYAECDRAYALSEYYRRPYVILGLACLGSLANWANKKGIPKKNILCIFEDGDEGQSRLIELARADGFNAIPQSKRDIRAFDACDLAAWKTRTLVHDTWERELQMKDRESAVRIINTLGQVESLLKSASEPAMLTASGLRIVCDSMGLARRS